jgi:hypothetical protein
LKKGIFLLLLMVLPLLGFAHPFHSSVGECVYNAKEKTWEISIRLFQEGPQTDKVLDAYLRKHLGVNVNQQLTTPYRYLGWEAVKDVIWVYVEIPTEQNLKGMFWENSLLADTFPDQTNLFHVARGEQKQSYLFQANKWIQVFE